MTSISASRPPWPKARIVLVPSAHSIRAANGEVLKNAKYRCKLCHEVMRNEASRIGSHMAEFHREEHRRHRVYFRIHCGQCEKICYNNRGYWAHRYWRHRRMKWSTTPAAYQVFGSPMRTFKCTLPRHSGPPRRFRHSLRYRKNRRSRSNKAC
ncbi:hypothetical protein GGR50DRAFT_100522 [Xylaria sp. CBS 124048]|nr:hypothetical protein GGR50DRAFT_100522 [Xylaria sp. CBS 124048]